MKVELIIDDDYDRLARYLGFHSACDMIEHLLTVAAKTKDCPVLIGKDKKTETSVLACMHNPKETKAQRKSKQIRRRRRT